MSVSSDKRATLYIVATPIGNFADFSPRAREVLAGVEVIAAEDTRHSARLLQHMGIATPCVAYHEHNERTMCDKLVGQMLAGTSVALISDAGTPMISDPGYHLVRAAQEAGILVRAIPGPSALVTALSVSGLPSDRFVFEGFLPAKSGARRSRLQELMPETRTLIFYESPHRILDSLTDMVAIFGAEREGVIARELTKTYETVRRAPLGELQQWVAADHEQQLGEIVVLIHGAPSRPVQEVDPESARILAILSAELPLKQAAVLTAEITGLKKNALYKYGLGQGEKDE